MGWVTCPTFVVIARDDQIIPFENGEILHAASPQNFEPYFPQEGKHDSIKITNHDEYFRRLKEFLNFSKSEFERLGEAAFIMKYRGNLPQEYPHFYVEEFKPEIKASEVLGKNNILLIF